MRLTNEQRFWAKVNKTDTCWEWTASLWQGYGQFSIKGKSLGAHRYAYELQVGPIPEGLYIDHLCRNRKCVNAAHMEPVTNAENLRRGDGNLKLKAGLIHAYKFNTHCKWGHQFTEENTRVGEQKWKGGVAVKRTCKACETRKNRARAERKKILKANLTTV